MSFKVPALPGVGGFKKPAAPAAPTKSATAAQAQPVDNTAKVEKVETKEVVKAAKPSLELKTEDGRPIPRSLLNTAYTLPTWGGNVKEGKCSLEVVKDGCIVEVIDLTKQEAFVVGRHPENDIIMEHPTISRHHAVIQMRETGQAYLYDLGSTHGSFWNKTNKIAAQKHVPLKVGDMIKFGQSTRMFILSGDVYDKDEAEGKREEAFQAKVAKSGPTPVQQKLAAKAKREAALMGFLQGQQCGWGQSQSEAVDENAEAHIAAVTEDTIDSRFDDDDEFYDRTGAVQRKAAKAQKQLSRDEQGALVVKFVKKTQTFESISTELVTFYAERGQLNERITAAKETAMAETGDQDTDAYVMQLRAKESRVTIDKLQRELVTLEKKISGQEELLEMVRPALAGLGSSGPQKRTPEVSPSTSSASKVAAPSSSAPSPALEAPPSSEASEEGPVPSEGSAFVAASSAAPEASSSAPSPLPSKPQAGGSIQEAYELSLKSSKQREEDRAKQRRARLEEIRRIGAEARAKRAGESNPCGDEDEAYIAQDTKKGTETGAQKQSSFTSVSIEETKSVSSMHIPKVSLKRPDIQKMVPSSAVAAPRKMQPRRLGSSPSVPENPQLEAKEEKEIYDEEHEMEMDEEESTYVPLAKRREASGEAKSNTNPQKTEKSQIKTSSSSTMNSIQALLARAGANAGDINDSNGEGVIITPLDEDDEDDNPELAARAAKMRAQKERTMSTAQDKYNAEAETWRQRKEAMLKMVGDTPDKPRKKKRGVPGEFEDEGYTTKRQAFKGMHVEDEDAPVRKATPAPFTTSFSPAQTEAETKAQFNQVLAKMKNKGPTTGKAPQEKQGEVKATAKPKGPRGPVKGPSMDWWKGDMESLNESWHAPAGQKGDGKTHLNEKLGY